MADLGVMTQNSGAQPSNDAPAEGGRRIERRRGLPGSRAVVGALLVAAAAVGVFAAYLNATAEPATRYVVVQGDIPVGTLLTEAVLRDTSQFGLVPIDLPTELAANAIPESQALALAGLRTTAPLAAGDLLSRTVVEKGVTGDELVQLSFALDASRALDGALDPGARIDIAVTYGQGLDSFTYYVARNILLSDIRARDSGIDGGELVLTITLADDERALAINQAVNTGTVTVSRAAPGATSAGDGVPPYAPPASAGGAELVPSETDAGAGETIVPVTPESPATERARPAPADDGAAEVDDAAADAEG
jgi:hypothetical protein